MLIACKLVLKVPTEKIYQFDHFLWVRKCACSENTLAKDHKTSLRFSSLLEGLAELSASYLLIVKVYYSQRMGIKISQGKRYIGQSPGKFQI